MKSNIHPTVILDIPQDRLEIGTDVLLQPYVVILGREHISIGDGTFISPNVTITDLDHNLELPYSNIQYHGKKAPINIGKHCWVGSNAVILKGVTLGDGCVVGAGAVVTKSFPKGSIIVGNPARLLRKRT